MMFFFIILISGCISIVNEEEKPKCIEPEKFINGTCCFDDNNNGICDINEKVCPDCDDGDNCTNDYCSKETNYECVHKPITPCCGNHVCEKEEDEANICPEDCVVIKITDFYHSYGGPDYIENDTYVFIHTGSNLTDKKSEFYLNITAKDRKLVNIKATYNCTDSITGRKIDSINVERVELVEGHPQFGYENVLDSQDYLIYTSFYTPQRVPSIEVKELDLGNTTQYRIRVVKKTYKSRGQLTCDFNFYFLEPKKRVKKTLKLSFI